MSSLAVKCLIVVSLAIGYCKSYMDLICLTEAEFNIKYSNSFSKAILQENAEDYNTSFYAIAKKTEVLHKTTDEITTKYIKTKNNIMHIQEFANHVEGSDEKVLEIYNQNKIPCAFYQVKDEFANDFIGTECLTRLDSCIIINTSLYLIGDAFEGDMASKDMLMWFRSLNAIEKLKIMRDFAKTVGLLHKNKLYRNEIEPRFLLIKNKKEKSVFVRLNYIKDDQIYDLDSDSGRFGGSFFKKFLVTMYTNTEKNDIYTLALSFLFMLSNGEKTLQTIEKKCSGLHKNNYCHSLLIKEISNILSKEMLISLTPVIKTAMAINPFDNYESMEYFWKDIDTIISKGISEVNKLPPIIQLRI